MQTFQVKRQQRRYNYAARCILSIRNQQPKDNQNTGYFYTLWITFGVRSINKYTIYGEVGSYVSTASFLLFNGLDLVLGERCWISSWYVPRYVLLSRLFEKKKRYNLKQNSFIDSRVRYIGEQIMYCFWSNHLFCLPCAINQQSLVQLAKTRSSTRSQTLRVDSKLNPLYRASATLTQMGHNFFLGNPAYFIVLEDQKTSVLHLVMLRLLSIFINKFLVSELESRLLPLTSSTITVALFIFGLILWSEIYIRYINVCKNANII